MIYFDNAATTFTKPRTVYKAVKECITKYNANPGRSGHNLSLKVSEVLYEARETVSDFFGYPYPESVIFTQNATYALNLAIKSAITEKCHIIISNLEHNSVLRPIVKLKESLGVEYSVYNAYADNLKTEIERHIREDTKFIISTIASNVVGKTIPPYFLSEIAKKHNLRLIIDASQYAGHRKLNLESVRFDSVAMPAHKALLGIMGLGVCIINKDTERSTVIEGGSGNESRNTEMPRQMPERYEAGTVSLPAISALSAGIKYIEKTGIYEIQEKIEYLTQKTVNSLENIEGISIYGKENGIVSFNLHKKIAEYVANQLNHRGICVRAGLHCAPLAHKTIGTLECGCVRISLSYFNTVSEIRRVAFAIQKIAKESFV